MRAFSRTVVSTAVFLISCCGALTGLGQTPVQLTPFTSNLPDRPRAIAVTSTGSEVFFSTTVPTTPGSDTTLSGLWRSDGSAAGTFRFRAGVYVELNANGAPTTGDAGMDPVVIDGIVYFVGYNGQFDGPRGLWRSDLSANGTFEIMRFTSSGAAPVNVWPSKITKVGSSLYFAVENAVWRSNGSTATTQLMHDFGNATPGGPAVLAALGNSLIFSTTSAQTGAEAGIWKSNGTPATTTLIKPLAYIDTSFGPDPTEDAASRRPVQSGGLLYFAGAEGTGPITGSGLWRSDGTLSGTFEVRRFEQFAITTPPRDLTPLDGNVSFRVGQQIWSTTGTDASTHLIFDLASLGGTITARPSALTGVGGVLLFSVNESTTPGAAGLWRSNGTSDSTFRFSPQVKIDLSTSAIPGNTASRRPLVVGPTAFFAGADPSQPATTGPGRLWRTDLLTRGTFLLAEFVDPVFTAETISPDSCAYAGGYMFVRAGGNVFSLRPQVCPSDFNGDGEVNADDLGDFITTYFTPCP